MSSKKLRFKIGIATILFGILGEISGAFLTWQIFLVAKSDCYVWPPYLDWFVNLIQQVTNSWSPCKNGPGLDGWYSWELSFSWMLVAASVIIAGATVTFFSLEGVR